MEEYAWAMYNQTMIKAAEVYRVAIEGQDPDSDLVHNAWDIYVATSTVAIKIRNTLLK